MDRREARELSEASYRFRASLAGKEETYTITEASIEGPLGRVALDDVASVRLYLVPGARSLAYGTIAQPARRCTIRLGDGRKIALVDQHFLGIGRFENRAASYVPFVRAVIDNLAARHADARLFAGMPPGLWWFSYLTFAVLAAVMAFIALCVLVALLVGQAPWTGVFILLGAAVFAIGPLSFLRGLRRRRPQPLDPANYQV